MSAVKEGSINPSLEEHRVVRESRLSQAMKVFRAFLSSFEIQRNLKTMRKPDGIDTRQVTRLRWEGRTRNF